MKILRNTSAVRGGRFTAPRAAALALFVLTSGAAVAQQVGLPDTRYDGGRRALRAADLDQEARLANTGVGLVRRDLLDEPIPPHRLRGDIILPEDGYSGGIDSSTWNDGVIPFVLDDDFSDSQVEAIILAMQEWESVATVDFVPFDAGLFTKKLDIISTGPEGSSSATVGQQAFDPTCNLADWALLTYSVHHELGHVLGYHHEHMREDRDDFVFVNSDNIESAQMHNFFPANAQAYGPYDYDSVMHYGPFGFAIDDSIPTLTALLPEAQSVIGQRDHLSDWDMTAMSLMYPEDDWLFLADDGASSQQGTFFKPYHGMSVDEALDEVSSGGTLIVMDEWSESLPHAVAKAVTIRAPVGGVVFR